MTKHTPGPWTVQRQHPAAIDGSHIVVEDGHGFPVAQAHPVNTFAPGPTQAQANAALIAAAPDLLEIAMAYLTHFESHHITNTRAAEGLDFTGYLAEKARAAIAKATGEQA